ncbi:unnamed protein product, partial [Mesorhabditis belari]|uniref:Major facilitator superfamily domain-containing protein 12 n=1 Tax=Mesorhabditis belari TaxID=2138241 RepID=A0AAF3EH86_9BILA
MLFFSFFKTLVGKEVVVELKNDVCLHGTLHSVDQYLNMTLHDTQVTDPDRFPHLIAVKNAFIRGSVVRYVQLPEDQVDTELLADARMDDVIPVRNDEEVENRRRLRRQLEERDINFLHKLSYSMGHFYNDLCASMWFTYLMIYMEKVIQLESGKAGMLMLIGQATDAICTPLVGLGSDHAFLPAWIRKIGRRMSWHVIGAISVTISFPFIYNQCFPCTAAMTEWVTVLWYIPFIMVFQFGWASVQISHLAMIPDLSTRDESRSTMNSMRYAWTVLANISVFGILAFLLRNDVKGDSIGPQDLKVFMTAGLIVVGAGLVSLVPFYALTREHESTGRSRRASVTSDASELVRMHWTSWFGHIQFYQIAFLYMLVRLIINISQVYFPFYVTITQGRDKSYVAILPMVSYISSFFMSTIYSIPFINRLVNKKILFLSGILVGIGNCIWMRFDLPGWEIYGVATLLGFTQSILIVTSLAITADLINKNTESGAFVYGAMSFVDKLANGIAYQIIELINPSCNSKDNLTKCANFYRNVESFVPGGCLILALIVLISLLPQSIGERRRAREEDRQPIISDNDDNEQSDRILVYD